jgi:tetratricopeptide (TPR) repeat protein
VLRPTAPAACLDENDAVAFVERAVAPAERARHEAHLDGCEACRHLVSELARALAPAPGAGGGAAALARGATLGRYVLLEVLGAGAMGVVYAAFDPELDRKVALKLLQAGGGEGASLAREARAMARVDHPNVVRVYDAGGEGGRFYFVMTLVEGASLSEHLRAGARGWRETLELFVKAGRGLEAAHRAGLVHRDFKPDNVLVGRGGEVRVTDFGLARAAAAGPASGARPPPSGGAAAGAPGARSTSFAGTPAYMAPEQLRGEAADARSDQFAFCVALYEALCGGRPFEGVGVEGRLAAIERGRVRRASRGAGPPARVFRAIERGLSADPARRFGSMGELLDALSRERARRALVVAGLALAALGPVAAYGARRARLEAACAASAAEAGRAWGGPRRARVEAAFAATGLPFAAETFASTAAALDRYAGALAEMRGASCRATRLRGEQGEELYERRRACLDGRLAELDALASQLERVDAKGAERAPGASRDLAPVAQCADATALLAPIAEPPALRERVAEVRRRLAEARATVAVGSAAEGLAAARRALADAEALGQPLVSAEALVRVGEIERDFAAPEAEARLFAAVRAAEEARADLLKARAASNLAFVVAYQNKEYRRGHDWADFALSALARVGGDDGEAARVYTHKGAVLVAEGRFDEAGAAFERALALAEGAGLDPHASAVVLLNLAAVRHQQRRPGEAIELYARALRLFAESDGPRSFRYGMALNGRASAYETRGDDALARADHEAFYALMRETYGPEHHQTFLAATFLFGFEAAHGAAAATVPRALELLATAERALDPTHQDVQDARLLLAQVFYLAGRPAEALAPASRVLAERSARLGDDDGSLFVPLAILGNAELALGRPDDASPHLERALALRDRWNADDETLAELALHAARASERRAPAKACGFARQARDLYDRARAQLATPPAARDESARATDAWLAAHHCPAPTPEGATGRR